MHAASEAILDRLAGTADWQTGYVLWELTLLRETGAGLDLTRCAVTGGTDDLAYVSPRTGRAVSKSSAGSWAPRLLPLPEFLRTGAAPAQDDVLAALQLTGYFLHRNAVTHGRRALPPARLRLVDRLAASASSKPPEGSDRQ